MKYDYDGLKRDLNIGDEIEFWYKDEKNSISNNKQGWYLIRFDVDKKMIKSNRG